MPAAAGADRGVTDAGDGWEQTRSRVRKPRAFAAEPRERRHHGRMRIEIVCAHRVEDDDRHDARLWRCRRRSPPSARVRCRSRWPARRRWRRPWGNVLLFRGAAEGAGRHERRAVKEDRNARVVVPRRTVHEGIERIFVSDDVALLRDDKYLTAAAGEISAGKHREPLIALAGRRRRGRAGGHRGILS